MDDLYLQHHGIKGMKWGVRRYQNPDGSLTPAGKKRQAKQTYKSAKREARSKRNAAIKSANDKYNKSLSEKHDKLKKIDDEYDRRQRENEYYKRRRDEYDERAKYSKGWADYYKDGQFESQRQIGKIHERDYEGFAQKRDEYSRKYDVRTEVNRVVRDMERTKVEDLYKDATAKANSKRGKALAKAGEEYTRSVRMAKMTYKDAKRQIKENRW